MIGTDFVRETDYMYGQYRMHIRWMDDSAQVTVYDVENLRWPMMWSKTMSQIQAIGAHQLFEQIGYFEMPV